MFVMVGVLFGRLPRSKFCCFALFGNCVSRIMFMYDVVLISFFMLCILILMLMQSLLNIHETIHFFDTITTQDFPTLTSQR